MSSSSFHLIHISKYSLFVGLIISYNPVNSLAHCSAHWREVVGFLYVRVPAWFLLEHHLFFYDKLLNTVPIRSVIVN
jgi:hypothetical protein